MRLRASFAGAVIAALAAAAPAHASTYTVTGTADSTSGTCNGTTVCSTLRAAIGDAQKAPGADTIKLAAGTYHVDVAVLTLADNVTIAGDTAQDTLIQSGGKTRVFIVSGTGNKVTLSHLTLTGGNAVSTSDGIGGDVHVTGGATLNMDHSRVTGGSALGGGGIGIDGSATVNIATSTIDGNSGTSIAGGPVGYGGAIASIGVKGSPGNQLTLTDSSVYNNQASVSGGLALRDNTANTTTITRSTIALNRGNSTGGAGVWTNDTEAIKVSGSIVSGNTGDGVSSNCSTKLTPLGASIDSGSSCGLEYSNTDPQLVSTPVQYADTPMLTFPATSPAIDLIPKGSAACTGAITDQRDLARPQGGGCDAGAFELDTVAPDVTITAGPSGPTNNPSPSFSFSSTDGTATFTCALETTPRPVTCTSPRSYSGVPDGPHTFTVIARDPSGNTTQATRSFTVDTVAPTAPTITTPAADGSQKTATVALGGGAEPNSTVTVSEGATVRSTVTASGQGTWSTSFAAADGVHPYTAKATDAALNVSGASNTRTITVDTVAPAVSVTSGPSGLINVTSASFGFTAETGAATTCQMDTGTIASCTSPAAYNGLGQGGHTFTVRATDAAGNVGTATRSFTVDSIAPAAPAITTPVSDTTQSSAAVTVGGTAEPNASVQLFDNGVSKGTAAASGQGTWSIALNGVSEGVHPYTAKASDAAGNTSVASNVRTITVDMTAPTVSVTSGPSGPTNTASPAFGFTAETGATTTCQMDSGGFTSCSSPASYSNLGQGQHTFTVRAADAAGNSATASRTFTVDTIAPAAPSITSPADNALQSTATVTLSGTAEGSSTVVVVEGGTQRGSTTASAGGSWTVTISGVGDGSHTYTATARDAAANTSPASAAKLVRVDTTAPAAPAITTPASDTLQGSSTVTLGGSAEANATVAVFDNGVSKGTTTATGGNWTLIINNVPDGAHPYTAKASDAAGNVSPVSATRTVTVDTNLPDTTITAGPSGLTRSAAPSFSFSSTKAASTFTCTLTGPGQSGTPATCTSPKAYSGLTDGAYTFSVRATDPAGNNDPTPASRAFTVDTTPPPEAVTAGPDGPTTDASPSFTFGSPDSATTFDCKLDGPGAAVGTFRACTSPTEFTDLAPGDYTFTVRATDAAGNSTISTREFSIALVAQATPTPTPTPGPVGPAQNPLPVYQKTVVIQPAGGKTLVQLPGTTTFVPVDVTRGIPLGSVVDTRHSKIRLYAIPKPGKPAESALFYDGLFKVTQLANGVTQLALVEQLAKCTTSAKKASTAAKKKPKTRKLWGDGSGSFSTRGQYSAATVRGTKWLVQDSCGKTLTKVAKGVVSVQDLVKKKTVLVRAPKSYTAKKKR